MVQVDQRNQLGAQPDHRHTINVFHARGTTVLVVADHLEQVRLRNRKGLAAAFHKQRRHDGHGQGDAQPDVGALVGGADIHRATDFLHIGAHHIEAHAAPGQGFLADRFSYVPYIGLVFMMAHGGEWLADKRKKLLPLIGIVAVTMVLFYAGYSFNRVGVWKTTETLFTDVLKYDKNVSVAFRNRGNYYRDHKINDKAMDDYANLMRLTPNDPNAYFSRGKLYFEKKDYDKAFNDFNKSIKLDSNNAIAFSNRGTIYGTRQQWDLALKDFNRALVLKPDMKDALLNRGLLFYNLRRFDEAIKDLDYYCTLQPGNSKAINLRGLCKVSKQDYQGALKDYDESILLDQTEGNYFLNRALLYSFLGNKLKAFADAQKAQQMGIKVDPAFMEKIKK